MTDNRKKMLEVKDLRQHFRLGSGSTRIDIKAVDGVTFDIFEGEVFGLVGESGCGKTTTGRSIIKLYKPTDGTVKFDGKVIGAGFSGNVRNIRKAKRETKVNIIKADDYKYERFLIKDKHKALIKNKKADLKEHKELYKTEMASIKSYNENLKTEMDSIKSKIKLEISEVEYETIIKIDEINKSMKKIIEHNYKISIDSAKKRFEQKKSYLPESLLSKEEKDEEYGYFLDELIRETINIEEQYLKDLKEYNPEKYVSTANKIYNRRIRKTKDEAVKAAATKKLNSLDSFVVDLKAMEMSPEERRIEVAKVYKNEKKLVDALKKEQAEKLASYSKRLRSKQELKPKEDEIKKLYMERKTKTKAEIASIRLEQRKQLQALRLEKKNNPEKFTVDKEKQSELRKALRETIAAEKAEIKRLKKLNKIQETEEERASKLVEIEEVKKSYAARIAEYETEVSKVKAQHEANPQDKDINEQLKEAEKELRELNIELQREVDKANTANSYAGVMSQLQMIFQDPVSSLNPRKTVKEIISEGLIIQGIKDQEYIDRKVAESLSLVGLAPDHSSRYPHEFSGGQRQRIGIARALIVNPKFIIADEPISALDVSIQAQIINLLKDLKDELGLTILFIAHDLSVVKYFSDRIAVMYFGKIVEQTTSEELFKNPLHPYTKSLLSAIPNPDPDSEKTRVRTTYDPSIHNYSVDKPEMVEIKPGHFIYANKAEVVKYKQELKARRDEA